MSGRRGTRGSVAGAKAPRTSTRTPKQAAAGRGHAKIEERNAAPPAATPALGFPHREHLTGIDFLKVMAKGEKRSCTAFHLYHMTAAEFGAGVCVSRRLGTAVVRNRIKRVLREAIRLTRPQIQRPCHLVLVARLGADRLEVDAAKASLTELYASARLLATEPVQP